MGSNTREAAAGSIDGGSDDFVEGAKLRDEGGLEVEREMELGNRRHEMFPVLSGSKQKNTGTLNAHQAEVPTAEEQRDRCNSSNFKAASPRGDAVRSDSISQTAEGERPIERPISAKVIPFSRRSEMREAHGVMGTSLREPVYRRQRYSVTEFRDNAQMGEAFGDRVRRFREEARLSRDDLVRLAKIKYSTLADIEDKSRRTSRHAAAIAGALKKTVRELLTGEPGSTPMDVPTPPPFRWPFDEIRPDDLAPLDRIEIGHVERAMQRALQEVRTERRRRRSG